MYIVTRLIVQEKRVEVLSIYDLKSDARNFIADYVNDEFKDKQVTINNDVIKVYTIDKGITYNSKYISDQLQIIYYEAEETAED